MESPNVERATVLIVDDDPSVRQGLSHHLRRSFRVLLAGSAREAMEALAQEPVDVVITDHRMPGTSGLNFLRMARDRFPDTARIMLTGFATTDLAIRATNEGEIHRFLEKPVSPAALEVAVHAAVEKVRVEREHRRLRSLLSVNPDLEDRLRAAGSGTGPRGT